MRYKLLNLNPVLMGTKSGDLSSSEDSIEHAPRYAPRTRSGVRVKVREGREVDAGGEKR